MYETLFCVIMYLKKTGFWFTVCIKQYHDHAVTAIILYDVNGDILLSPVAFDVIHR